MGSLSHSLIPAKKPGLGFEMLRILDLIAIPRHKRQAIKSSLCHVRLDFRKIQSQVRLYLFKKKSQVRLDF